MRNLWNTIIAAFGFGWVRGSNRGGPTPLDERTLELWYREPFFTEHQRKTEKLASLARWIEGARVLVERRKKAKKKHSDVLAAIQKAQRHRLEIETGKRVYDPAFGDWILKEDIK